MGVGVRMRVRVQVAAPDCHEVDAPEEEGRYWGRSGVRGGSGVRVRVRVKVAAQDCQ